MNWHYAIDGERRGPVSDEEFQGLVRQGVIVPETLVWREGMSDWAPYGVNISSAPPIPAGSVGDVVHCAGCQQPTAQIDTVEIGGALYCAACKPRALRRLMGGTELNSQAEETRKLHLNHEASLKSVGLLYYLGGAGLLFAGMGMAIPIPSFSSGAGAKAIGMGVFFLALAVAYFFVATGLRRLRPWARIASAILSGIGLLGFPLGTLINGYFLYLLLSKKGKMVFSPEYQEVIRETPHIKYRTSIVAWIFLGLVLIALVGTVLALVLGKR